MLFTADSHNPPKFGARSGMNFQPELGDDSLYFLMFEEFCKFFQFTGSANEICSMIAANVRGFAVTSSEALESSDEGICGQILRQIPNELP